jgi:prephenate dehydrogenase
LFRDFRRCIAVIAANDPRPFNVLFKAEEADMKDAKTYREYAADCRRMAQLMNKKDKEALLKMAEAWEDRAKEAERRKDG